jgi:DUF971 family protein
VRLKAGGTSQFRLVVTKTLLFRRAGWGRVRAVRAVDIQHIGGELAIKWADGSESFITLEKLRHACPCAACKGEMDVMGNLYKGPEIKLRPESFALRSLVQVGTYAVQPTWGDGHNSGLYSYEYLRNLAG